MSLKLPTKITMQAYKCNIFLNSKDNQNFLSFSFNCKLNGLVSQLIFPHTKQFWVFTSSPLLLPCSLLCSLHLVFCRLEVLKLLNSSNLPPFCILISGSLSLLHLLLLRHWLCTFSFSVLHYVGGHFDAIGGSPLTPLLFHSLLTTR